MIKVDADMTGVGAWMGVVGGMVKAMEDPRFQGDYIEHLTGKIRTTFMTDTVAAHMNDEFPLDHVFEWGSQTPAGVATGNKSKIPLFKIVKSGLNDKQMMTFVFLPSHRPVPLPDPEVYGFKPEILDKLSRHIFQMKALVMETQSSVNIGPVSAQRLFIPSFTANKGYVMTAKTVTINPGGNSTGRFATWWTTWFDMRAQEIAEAEAELTEEFLAATGRKVTRYADGTVIGGKKVGGRFAKANGVSVAYVNAQSEKVKREVMTASEKFFDEDSYWGQFDE
jgi:hypothetical protein